MSTPITRRLAAVIAVASLGVVAACSSSSTSTTGTTAAGGASTTVAKGSTGTTTGKGTTITVMMNEWELLPSATSAPAGSITFTATNNGKEVHEVALFKSDLDPAKLPLDEEGAVDERGAGVELIDEVEDIKPGETKSFTVDVVAGNYVLVCNLVEKGTKHYEHNMYKPFKVT